MGVVKYGAILTEIKGKVGGTVFQGGKSAAVVKNKPNFRGGRKNPVPPPSTTIEEQV